MSRKQGALRPLRQRATPAVQSRQTKTARSQSYPLVDTLNSVSSQIWALEAVKAYTIETVEKVLKIRRVPKHRVCAPSLEVTIPAIEAMRYSPLRREIAALIASTMDRDNADVAHPSFLNMLQQLTQDEVNILRAFPDPGRVLPVANLLVNLQKGYTEILHRNIIPQSIAELCTAKSKLPFYIDNLTRLHLLHEPHGVKIDDARIYADLLRQEFCERSLQSAKVRKRSMLEKHTLSLTIYGDLFRKTCFV
ncbi:MAG: Abi-alpha family protein [Pseudomonadota bacterium]